jgi:hypothetical protein
MPKSGGTNRWLNYRTWFWLLVTYLIIKSALIEFADGPGDADEVVLKRELPGGAWLYVTRYGGFATDLDTLRFFVSKPLKGDDVEILQQLNVKHEFLLTDSLLKDVEIKDTNNGIHIELRGAVYYYFSKQYVYKGEDLLSYRVTLTQKNHAWEEACGREDC